MSPQSRRGHAVPPSHRKPAPRVPSDAARKPATSAAAEGTATEIGSSAAAASAVTPKVSASVSTSPSGKAAKGKAGSRPTERKAVPASRRGRSLVRVGRSSTLRNIYSYVRAYVPLFIAFAIIFAGVWAWTSYGPHTKTPKENWTTIESNWKSKRAADLKAVSAAVAANDFNATLSGYQAASADTKGWMDELGTITNWEDASASPDPNQRATTTQFVQQLVTDGNAEVSLLNEAVAAKTPNDVLALKAQLDSADQAFQADYDAVRQAILGVAPSASGEPTLALPSGSLSPSASPDASAVPGSSAVPTAAASASATPS